MMTWLVALYQQQNVTGLFYFVLSSPIYAMKMQDMNIDTGGRGRSPSLLENINIYLQNILCGAGAGDQAGQRSCGESYQCVVVTVIADKLHKVDYVFIIVWCLKFQITAGDTVSQTLYIV